MRRVLRGQRGPVRAVGTRGRPMRPVWLVDRALHATTWVPIARLAAFAAVVTTVFGCVTGMVICMAFRKAGARR
ncbi:hypothetical protein [Kibdelosporangium phytohabitans]|uniref:hypothetical protein n=1 Tax=Kibdelosporangium phytohabitans TaxID=860235 RepID=UPI0012F7A5B5|nr:hypothetical protein [Kibdelosporangium phytohabitans]MBE1462699.1 hypothetical protein [Kibdelosporangium phytohabitans]